VEGERNPIESEPGLAPAEWRSALGDAVSTSTARQFAAWNDHPARERTLKGMLDELDRYVGPLTAPVLREEIARLHVRPGEVRPLLRFDPVDYQRVRLRRRAHYEALLLCWLPEQFSPIHDHGESACVVGVLSGEAVELNFAWNADQTLSITRWQRLRAGSTTASVGRDVHQVANWSRAHEPLVTLHVYSPPLAGVEVYRGTRVVPVPAARFGARQAVLEDCA
jgi:cysteine dioxygenase